MELTRLNKTMVYTTMDIIALHCISLDLLHIVTNICVKVVFSTLLSLFFMHVCMNSLYILLKICELDLLVR
jgi:hypothetical protein